MLHVQFYSDQKNVAYNVYEIHKITQSNKTITRSVKELINCNDDLGTNEGIFTDCIEDVTPEYRKKAFETSLNYPIIIKEDGSIVDGSHRLAKAFFLKHKTIRCKVITPEQLKKTRIRS
jgi:hypothetical protein